MTTRAATPTALVPARPPTRRSSVAADRVRLPAHASPPRAATPTAIAPRPSGATPQLTHVKHELLRVVRSPRAAHAQLASRPVAQAAYAVPTTSAVAQMERDPARSKWQRELRAFAEVACAIQPERAPAANAPPLTARTARAQLPRVIQQRSRAPHATATTAPQRPQLVAQQLPTAPAVAQHAQTAAKQEA